MSTEIKAEKGDITSIRHVKENGVTIIQFGIESSCGGILVGHYGGGFSLAVWDYMTAYGIFSEAFKDVAALKQKYFDGNNFVFPLKCNDVYGGYTCVFVDAAELIRLIGETK